MPRIAGWSKLFLDFLDGKPHLHILTERELLEAVVLAGRRVNGNYRSVIAHSMRCIGWKLRRGSRTYVRKVAALASEGGAS
jgi:hypothetical protein